MFRKNYILFCLIFFCACLSAQTKENKKQVKDLLKRLEGIIIDWFYTPSETDIKKAVSVKDGVKKFLRKVSFSLNKNISAKLWGGYSMMILASKNE